MQKEEIARRSFLDLRAPVAFSMSKWLTLASFRTPILIIADCSLITLAWHVAEVYGTPFASFWIISQNPELLFLILGIAVGIMFLDGLYSSGRKRRDYVRITQGLTLSHIFLLLIAYFYQPGYFVSRSTFIFSWFFSVLFVCAGRLVTDIFIEYLRGKGAILYPTYLLGQPKDVQAASELLNQENRYKIVGCSYVIPSDQRNWEETISRIIGLGVTEVFICSSSPIELSLIHI